MRHADGAECFGKGTENKPACTICECDGKHTMHELLTNCPTSVNILECEEDDDEEGCVNMITGENRTLEYARRRTLISSWLDL
jgi:hypothetical protein